MMRILRPSNPLVDLRACSVFLAGPTPRQAAVASWRPSAITAMKELGFDGDVLVPEPFTGDFESQVRWEYEGLEKCGIICFWIPRDLVLLPGFTTNVEFGRYVASGRVVYGRPGEAPKTRYLDWLYCKFCQQEPFEDLTNLLGEITRRLASG